MAGCRQSCSYPSSRINAKVGRNLFDTPFFFIGKLNTWISLFEYWIPSIALFLFLYCRICFVDSRFEISRLVIIKIFFSERVVPTSQPAIQPCIVHTKVAGCDVNSLDRGAAARSWTWTHSSFSLFSYFGIRLPITNISLSPEISSKQEEVGGRGERGEGRGR